MKLPSSKLTMKVLLVVIACVVVMWCLFPIAWFGLVSFTIPGHIPEGLGIPEVLSFDSYRSILNLGEVSVAMSRLSVVAEMRNSLIVGTMTVALCLLLAIGPSYILSRFSARYRELGAIFGTFLVVRTIPPVTIIISLFIILNKYRLMDTYWGLVLIETVFLLPMSVWLLSSFFDLVPRELEEQAFTDGASRFGTVFRVVLPLAAPGIAVTGCLVFLFSWIEYLLPLIITRINTKTLPLAIAGFLGEHQTFFNEMGAASLLSMIPLAIFFLVAGRYMVRGLTMGAFK